MWFPNSLSICGFSIGDTTALLEAPNLVVTVERWLRVEDSSMGKVCYRLAKYVALLLQAIPTGSSSLVVQLQWPPPHVSVPH